MNTRQILAVIPGFLVLALSSPGQGVLTPPGPPAPTMKTLDQLEARIPLTTFPATVNESGSYYLTRTVDTVPASLAVITINASDVTIDLNGYSLIADIGVGGGVEQSAIYLSSNTLHRITVKNGTIQGPWHSGVYAFSNSGMILENLRVTGTVVSGLWVSDNSRISGCIIDGGVSNHISSAGIHCGQGNQIRDCIVTRCSGTGIFGGGSGNLILDSVAMNNGGWGMTVGSGSAISRSAARGNDRDGIFCDTGSQVMDCEATLNGEKGISAGANSLVTRGTATTNDEEGIHVGNQCIVANCVAGSNGLDGLRTGANCRLSDCVAESNGLDGFRSVANCRLSDCVSTGNSDDGFQGSSGTILTGCIARDNTDMGFAFDESTTETGSAFVDCGAYANTVGFDTGDHARLDRCTARSNFGNGADLSSYSSAAHSTFSDNGAHGLVSDIGSVIKGCSSQRNASVGFWIFNSATVSDCTATRNQGNGFHIISAVVVSGCASYENGQNPINPAANGFFVNNSCRVIDCVAVRNRGAGIATVSGGNYISGNLTRSNTGDGIHLANNSSLVIGNISDNNTGVNIDFAGVGKVGPISATATGADPHANF